MAGAGRIARAFGDADLAARLAAEATPPVAGYLPYNPGPGIYSRLERAIEQMPENVRVQELPGLLKRYKDGVPGWELKETDLDAVIAGRDVVPREELLARVKERSPVYTHKEVVLGGSPPTRPAAADGSEGDYDVPVAVRQGRASRLGEGVSHGSPRFETYGQGGEKYSELLLVDPANPARELPKPHHFDTDYPGDFLDASRETRRAASAGTVAHARYDTHGDALRINEIQSDINNHNIKSQKDRAPRQGRTESDADYQEALQYAGWRFNLGDDGEIVGEPFRPQIPFAIEDTWSDLLIKRLALEAARQGHRAIEVVSPRAAAVSGGDLEHLQHLYGKVVPGALERLGRKMGGMLEEAAPAPAEPRQWQETSARLRQEADDYNREAYLPSMDSYQHYQRLVDSIEGRDGRAGRRADDLYRSLMRDGGLLAEEAAEEMSRLMSVAGRHAESQAAYRIAHQGGVQLRGRHQEVPPGRRYLMSDEMRRRLLQQGVGASLLAPLLLQDEAP